jgi:deazaflavin-dependent oxidoreductase (nitroreductase family)
MAMKTAGTPTTGTAVVRHTGRRSGRIYETPVGAVPTDDGFVIALPYGTNTDWLKNVLSSGSATVILRGREYQVDEPEVIPLTAATPYFTRADQQAHRLFGVEKSLRVRRTDAQRVV